MFFMKTSMTIVIFLPIYIPRGFLCVSLVTISSFVETKKIHERYFIIERTVDNAEESKHSIMTFIIVNLKHTTWHWHLCKELGLYYYLCHEGEGGIWLILVYNETKSYPTRLTKHILVRFIYGMHGQKFWWLCSGLNWPYFFLIFDCSKLSRAEKYANKQTDGKWYKCAPKQKWAKTTCKAPNWCDI